MNRGLLLKTVYETWYQTLWFGAAMLAAVCALTYVIPQVQGGINDVMDQIPFVRTIIQGLFGSDLGEQITAQMMQSVIWVHPTVLAILWAQEIVFCTRTPTAEIDRGTIDFLLGLPVSRRAVYCCESVAWIGTGFILLVMGLAGHLLAARTIEPAQRPVLTSVLLILANLYCVYLAVGGIAYLVAAFHDRRGRAVGIVFGLVMASFLLSFLAQFWQPAERLAFLSVLNYYQPAAILRTGAIPIPHIATLVGVAFVAWLAGGEVVARRSICTT